MVPPIARVDECDDHVHMLERIERLSPTTRTILRAALGIAIAIGLGLTTLALFFIGAVEFSGCFFECGEPNLIGGSLLLAGSAISTGLLFVAVAWGVGMNGRAWLAKTFLVGFGLVATLLLVLFTFG